MKNKNVGFLISRDADFSLVVRNPNWSYKELKVADIFLLIWSIGDISVFDETDLYTFSYPPTSSLEVRNLIIRLEKDSINIENDWLGSIPVFYNADCGRVSTNINYCFTEGTINGGVNEDGLNDYLEFGYCVFGNTQFNDIKFLRYYSKIIVSNFGIRIVEKDDKFVSALVGTETSSIKETINSIKCELASISASAESSKIILPLSGGLDSRLLAGLLGNKSNIKAYTYGVSADQANSYEVLRAKQTAAYFGFEWKQIQLAKYPNYIDEWLSEFGSSTHLHGMYQMEFYEKISREISEEGIVLSGIFGDIWASEDNFEVISCAEDLLKLGYTHGLNHQSISIKTQSKVDYYSKIRVYVNDSRVQPLHVVRMKIILISYLLSLPEYYGFIATTPFLSFSVVKNMLTIERSERLDRKWMKAYLSKLGIKLVINKEDYSNTLDFDIWSRYNFQNSANLNPIELGGRKFVIPNMRLDMYSRLLHFLNNFKFARVVIRKLSLTSPFMKKLRSYQTIYPLIFNR